MWLTEDLFPLTAGWPNQQLVNAVCNKDRKHTKQVCPHVTRLSESITPHEAVVNGSDYLSAHAHKHARVDVSKLTSVMGRGLTERGSLVTPFTDLIAPLRASVSPTCCFF